MPLLLFAKAPIVGKVKTRLMSHCSAKQASKIAELLMEASIEKACNAWPGQVYLSVWLDSEHDFFTQMCTKHPIQLISQCDGDLGEKMRHSLNRVGYPAAVMGCDAPHVLASTLKHAHKTLLAGQAVIGPSEDGGYYLLGLCRDADELFVDKSWGGDQVLPQTYMSADRIGLNLTHLPKLNDVDEWEDLIEAIEYVPSLHAYLQEQNLLI